METTSRRFLPFHVPLIEEDDIRAVCEVMQSGWITTGPRTVEFEERFARFVGARQAVSVNSGTAALHVALEAMGLKAGDEVVVPTLTFAATAEAVIYCGARPVLVDSEPDTFNLDPVQVERAITPRTRAIIPVHFAGHPCDMARILKIARDHGLKVIEDAAHALSARYKGRMVGTLGDATCFSFYATKNITTGEGGMATTEHDDWADRMRIMRLHGISKDAWKRYSAEGTWRYEILAPGFKYNMTDMQAGLGISQLAKCQAMWVRRNALAQRYTEALGALEAFEVPAVHTDVQHAWHLYVLRVCPGVLSIHRDTLIEELRKRGIGTSVHFIPLHLHPYYRDKWGYRSGDFPVAEDYFDRCISLPLYPAMTDDDQAEVIQALTEIAETHRFGGSLSALSRASMEKKVELNAILNHAEQKDASVSTSGSLNAANNRACLATVQRPKRLGGWYLRSGKRMLDIGVSAAGLIASIPILTACAVAVRLSSPGPILFRQRRVGRGGRIFELFKFRTMVAREDGALITAAGDPRITSVGRWLRRWKLDELPQLLNVLKGDMSMVGPRPEVPMYVSKYSQQQRDVLAYRPGITSPASITFIDEEAVLARQENREQCYTQVLLPQKLEIDMAYCRAISLSCDLNIILKTLRGLLDAKGRLAKGKVRSPSPLQNVS